MPIRTATPPESNVTELRAGVARASRHLSLWRHPTLPAGEGVPHTAHNVRLDHTREGTGMRRATAVGWRYYLGHSEHAAPSAAAEVHGGPGEEMFAGINTGPFVRESITAIERAHSDQALPATYEPRLLRVPALYVVALWLHAVEHGDDVVIPLPSSSTALQQRPYSVAELDAALQALAEQRRDDSALA
jgi:hypothetical protein